MVKKSASAPTIRFSSFSDDWEQQHLKTFFTPSRAKGNDGMPTLSVTINSGLVNRDELERKQLTNLTAEEHLLVRTGDIAYNMMRMWQGAFGRATTDGIVSPAYVVLRGKKNVDTRFFEYAFRRSRSIYLFWAYSYGLTKDRLRLYANDFTRIPFSAPKLPEQEKIADFLTAVDGRIGQLIQKRTLLEDYKKGVMQQLFTQAIRFKDDHGNDFPDWEEKKLGEVGNFIGGGTPDTNNESFWSGDIPWISSSDISDSSITQIKKHRFITPEAIKESAAKLVPENSILFISRVGVGKLAVSKEEVCTSQDFSNFTPAKDHLMYLGYYFVFNQNLLKRYAQGTSIQGITTVELKKIAIKIPCRSEQTKIADFLSAIDRKIESVATQITDTQTFKRGLLQQMFV